MSRSRILVGLIAAMAIALGVARDFLFSNLNYQLDHLVRHTRHSYAHSQFQRAVEGWSAGGLSALKWALALAFTAAMCTLCVLLARSLEGTYRHARAIMLLFLATGLLALVLHFTAVQLHSRPVEFVAVKLLHALQYPVPLLFIWVAHRIQRVA
ncbi:MAG: hypothetical protein JNM31_15560 [Flavobacteriales bacterium]|nr:hypothetical protein [Flavobacteriales bacterium]